VGKKWRKHIQLFYAPSTTILTQQTQIVRRCTLEGGGGCHYFAIHESMFFFKISYSWHFISPFCTSHKLEWRHPRTFSLSMSSFQWRKGQYFKGSVYCLFSCVSGRKSGCVTILSAAVSCIARRIVPLLTSSGEPNICFQSHLLCKSMSVLSYYVLTAYLHKLRISLRQIRFWEKYYIRSTFIDRNTISLASSLKEKPPYAKTTLLVHSFLWPTGDYNRVNY